MAKQPKDIESVEASIECDVPVTVAYNQWTQFEQFPTFMENVEQVEQLDDTHLHWVAKVAGKRKEWDAEILQQEPDRLISWRSTSGTVNNGSVTFEPIGTDRCKITCTLTYGLEDWTEKLGDALGLLKGQVQADLRRFKQHIEKRGAETGAWRGKVQEGKVERPGMSGGYGTGSSLGSGQGVGTPGGKKIPRKSHLGKETEPTYEG
jgi:uncharacterized membrane protein